MENMPSSILQATTPPHGQKERRPALPILTCTVERLFEAAMMSRAEPLVTRTTLEGDIFFFFLSLIGIKTIGTVFF
jgi:hypothetical protein